MNQSETITIRVTKTVNKIKHFFMIMINPMLIPGLRKKKPVASPGPTRDEIVKVVASEFGLKYADVFKKCRRRENVMSRQISMLIIRELEPSISLKTLGYYFGGKDHTTVIHSLRTIQDLMSVDEILLAKVNRIKSMI